MARLLIPATITNAAGAPSLRCLQGRVATMPTQPLSLDTKPPLRMSSWFPPLQRTQERGTHRVADAGEIKSLCHPAK